MGAANAVHGLEWIGVFGAGFLAGGINVVVGAGTLVSFPILVMLGCPPLTATIANTIGIVPGSATGVLVYRPELHALRDTVRLLLPASVAGGILGASILLAFPSQVFASVVPWLIGVGTLLVSLGPTITRAVAARGDRRGVAARPDAVGGTPFPSRGALGAALVGAGLLGTYGGYFSAAQGIILIGFLGILSRLSMQELNAVKNLTVFAVNVIAASVFLVIAPHRIEWSLVAVLALGASCGGMIGGRFARRLSAPFLRSFVVLVGVATMAYMLLAQ